MLQFEIKAPTPFTVFYHSDQDGGGTWFGQEYVSVIAQRYGRRFRHCLEWCAGPGFIGFALMAHHLCDRLCLVDSHLPLGDSIRATTQHNHCEQAVSFWCTDSLSVLPESDKFDLIVANPPHYLRCPGDANYQRLAVDPDWQAHRDFYRHVARYLAPDGVILLQENQAGSLDGPVEFRDMIEHARLKVTGYFTSDQYYDTTGPTQIYYIESRLR